MLEIACSLDAQWLPEAEGLSFHAKKIGFRRIPFHDISVNSEKRFRRKDMGAVGEFDFRKDFLHLERAPDIHGSVDEKGAIPPFQFKGMLYSELKFEIQIEIPRDALEPLEKNSPYCIVSSCRIAEAKDHDFRLHATFPSQSTISTRSGIFPTAWVAHERQGSKALIATSMPLSMPSVISVLPST